MCPVSRRPLVEVDRKEVLDDHLGEHLERLDAHRQTVSVGELTKKLLLRGDGGGAYPVVEGVPILLTPEMLVRVGASGPIDTNQDPYREAYEEMDFYNAEAAKAHADLSTSEMSKLVGPLGDGVDFLGQDWLDATYDIASQADAYAHISPMRGSKALQLGGKGVQAVKFLLAGATESWLLTPMLGEAVFARKLAAAFGVEDRFRSVVGIAEEIPFQNSSFDRIYSNGCIHHTITERAFPEIRRVLAPRGKFAAFEPWRAPGYRMGTKIFGKRERGINCRPMEKDRVLPLFQTFDKAAVIHHGTFTRYPLIALGKVGFRPQSHTINRITQVDDKLASRSSLRKFGSSVALLAESTDQ